MTAGESLQNHLNKKRKPKTSVSRLKNGIQGEKATKTMKFLFCRTHEQKENHQYDRLHCIKPVKTRLNKLCCAITPSESDSSWKYRYHLNSGQFHLTSLFFGLLSNFHSWNKAFTLWEKSKTSLVYNGFFNAGKYSETQENKSTTQKRVEIKMQGWTENCLSYT